MWVADYRGHIYAYGGLGTTSDQDIQDFSIKIRGSTGSLKVCVRDHECEDGDKIRVDVDGRSIFSGEIDNDWGLLHAGCVGRRELCSGIDSPQRHGIQGGL